MIVVTSINIIFVIILIKKYNRYDDRHSYDSNDDDVYEY